MATLEEFWSAVDGKRYDELQTLIRTQPELVNEKTEDGYSLLMNILKIKPISLVPINLIRAIARCPNFVLNDKISDSPLPYYNQSAIILSARYDILELFAEMADIIQIGDQLTYQIARVKYLREERLQKQESWSSLNVEARAHHIQKKINLGNMLTLLLERTLYSAFLSDKPDLLEKLETANVNLSITFFNGKPLIRLAEEGSFPALKTWFDNRQTKLASTAVVTDKLIFSRAAIASPKRVSSSTSKPEAATSKCDALDRNSFIYNKAFISSHHAGEECKSNRPKSP